MATKPGLLSDWPWKNLGSFKYMIVAPWALQSLYSLATKETNEIDSFNVLIIPFLLTRALHNQLWISFSRHRTAKGNNRILDRSIEFEQVDRETNWDDQILLQGILFYIFNSLYANASFLPVWRTDGVVIAALLHAGPVEYLYYWLHRALHHHYLYSRYHSHHHSSIVTEPISAVIHPFGELLAYFILFAIPFLSTLFSGTASLVSLFGYTIYIDFMNNMGHCNFEIVPKSAFSLFPPLKYLMYTPSFHSLHHTQFRTNYSLFMPLYDYIHGTMDKSTDHLHEASLERQGDFPEVVHLTHLTTPESLFHFQVGFASFASRPQNSKALMWLLPMRLCSVVVNVFGRTFVVERNSFQRLKLQSWAVPKHTAQYSMKRQRQAINGLIEEAILEADSRGVKVLSLGLLNQDEQLNRSGAIFVEKHPNLNVKVVDGSSLVVAAVVNSVPKGTTEILFRGKLSKIAFSIVSVLCSRGIKVATLYEEEKLELESNCSSSELVFVSKSYTQKIWIVGDGLTEDEQLKAPTGSVFIPYSQLPPKKTRKDILYSHTPSMMAPSSLQNLHSCENWLPRRAMSAWRAAGIVHALEGWNVNECGGGGDHSYELVWEAALKHGFQLVK